ncbi:MAG: NAD(P)H-hydrate epimerase [Candidatus Brocadiia bacterium]
MKKACTREQVRELDRRAMDEYGMPGVVLMENAGRGAAEVAAEMLGNPADLPALRVAGKRVVIFCGKGNNGGDGFVVGRHLHNRGAKVEFVLACPPEEIDPWTDAGINLQIAQKMGLHLHLAAAEDGRFEAAGLERSADLIVDALLGTGLTGDVREPYLSLIRLINAADKPVLAIDIPSGLDCDAGRILRAAVRATRTATFVLPKLGFTLAEGPAQAGQVVVVDIGIPKELVESIE